MLKMDKSIDFSVLIMQLYDYLPFIFVHLL